MPRSLATSPDCQLCPALVVAFIWPALVYTDPLALLADLQIVGPLEKGLRGGLVLSA
ncbi:hypothetical protein DFAR_3690064 [Desulfarculales bacterium]